MSWSKIQIWYNGDRPFPKEMPEYLKKRRLTRDYGKILVLFLENFQ
jgi:hypothetical protein